MLKIYHVPGTRGYRAIWACEELNTPYELIRIDPSPQYRASAQWRRMNPVGKMPAMTDGDLVMFESCAMVQYIVDKYGDGQLQPKPGTADHALYLQWGWFAESTFARPLGEIVNHRRAFPDATIPAVIEEMKGRSRLCLEAVSHALESQSFLVGDNFSAADIMMAYSLRIYTRLMEEDLPDSLRRYWERLSQRPAFQATEKAN